jgi:hypothetical protein
VLAEGGSAVVVFAADVAERAEVAGLLETIAASGPQLAHGPAHRRGRGRRGLDRLDAARFATVLRTEGGRCGCTQ